MRDANSQFPFLSGGGQTADLIARFDWASTALGPISQWPQSLKSACSLLLRSPVPIVMLWGEDGYMIYNDAYSEFAGGRHPQLLGSKVREGWPEVADFNDNVMKVGLAGGTLAFQDQELVLYRHGRPEHVWMNLDYSPVLDEEGQPAGVIAIVVETTSKVSAEATLRESEARFRLVADSAPVMLWMGDTSGHCLYLNAPLRDFWGVRYEDIEKFDWAQTVHPDDHATLFDAFGKAMQEQRGFEVEARYQSAKGQYRLIRTIAQPRFDGAGKFLGMVGVNTDITDIRLEEKRRSALIELSDRFRSVEDPAEIAFTAAHILGKALQVCRAGYATIDPIAETLTIEKDWTAAGVQSLTGTHRLRDYGDFIDDLKRGETVILQDATRDDRTRRATKALQSIGVRSLVCLPIREQGGTVALLYLTLNDQREWTGPELAFIREVAERTRTAVERRRAEQALEEFAESLEKLVAQRTLELDRVWRNSQDIMLIIDADGVIRAVSPAWTNVLGHSSRLVNTHSMTQFAFPEDRKTLEETLSATRTGPYIKSVESRFRHMDGGTRWINWRFTFEDDLIFAYGRDITSEKEQAAVLKQTEEQLRQAQKMEAIGQLTGGIAHDFNNLLQVITGNLQILAQDLSGDASAEKRIENALAGVERGAKLANQLLAFGRRQPLEPKVVNIGRFVRNMGELLRRTLGEMIEIETVAGAGLWNTMVDPTQIENAVLNLAINSRDAMEGHGKLTIEVGNAFIDEIYARSHPEVEPGQYVMLAVTDTGTGMPPDIVARVFEPFFSTKPLGKGTGLGLSMVYGFVKQSGGHLKIYSEVGQGTTIRLYLPRCLQDEDKIATTDYGPPTGGSETILVAEDDEQVRATVVDILERLGYNVLKAKDAASALSVIESGVHVDLLFTDVVMPGPMKSTETVRKVKERLPDLAVLFTSGYTENSIVHGGRLDVGVELLSKPYNREALARKIRHLLNNRAQVLAAKDRRNHDERKDKEEQSGADAALSTHRSETAPRTVSSPGTISPPETISPLKILVVEDEALIRMDLVDMLEEMGFEIEEAGSGEEAIDRARGHAFDIVLTDLGLPKMSGEELANALREKDERIGVVFATGNSHAPPLSVGRPPVLLKKPYDLKTLKEAIGQAAG